MELTSSDLTVLTGLAIAAANDAGQMITHARPVEVEYKETGASPSSQVVTEIDRRAEAMIIAHLGPSLARFELGLLTEERADDGSRLQADHFWCVDPLDGTLPFIEGQPGSAVSIALVRRNGVPLVGVIYDLTAKMVLHAVSGRGAFIGGELWSAPKPTDRLAVFADRSFLRNEPDRLVAALERVAEECGLDGADIHTGAGGVMNAVGALQAPPGCYLKLPGPDGSSAWDLAATACVFAEAGAVATDGYGEPLELNRQASTFVSHRGVVFATDERLAAAVRRLVDLVG